MRPLVTVIIPTRNRAGMLGRAVESVLAQKSSVEFRNLVARTEVLISDDASEDETPRLVEVLTERHPNVRGIRHEARLGVNRNYTAALRESRGEFVAFLSDDDAYAPTMNLRRLQRLAARPDAVLCYTAHRNVRIDAEGRAVARKDTFPHLNTQDEKCAAFIERMVTSGRTHTWNSVMFRGDEARAVAPLLDTPQGEADVEFQLRLAARTGMGATYVHERLLTRYHHAGNYYLQRRREEAGTRRSLAAADAALWGHRARRGAILAFARDYRLAALRELARHDPDSAFRIGHLMAEYGRQFGWSRLRIAAIELAKGSARDASETAREAEIESDDAIVWMAARALRGASAMLRFLP